MADLKLMDSKWNTKVYHDVYRIGAPDTYGEFALFVEDPHCFVTLSKDEDTWQCDKTPAEMAEALSEDRELYAIVAGDLLADGDDIGQYKFLFPMVGELSEGAGYVFSGALKVGKRNLFVTISITEEGVEVETQNVTEAYVLPEGGIPESDLSDDVKGKLAIGVSAIRSINALLPDNSGNISLNNEVVGADKAGSAAAVQENLDAHTNDQSIHVTAADKTAWNSKIPSSEKGAAGGVPTLDSTGKVPKGQLPPTVPDGGTAGQVLAKRSDSDGDVEWKGSGVNVNDVVQNDGDVVILNGGTSKSNASNLYQDANGQSF